MAKKFPGAWMDLDGHVVYRVVPKCACSTIGQLIYYGDHGEYFDGDIHDAKSGIHKWGLDGSQDSIVNAIESGKTYVYTSVRNPYSRVLSTFFDKIAGIQRNGQRYRDQLVPNVMRDYGVEVEGDFDQIKSFRRFLLFARDTNVHKVPMRADIHWSSIAGHLHGFVENGGRFNKIISTENFAEDMKDVLGSYEKKHEPDIDPMPRFNESSGHGPKQAHEFHEYFDDLSQHLVYEMFPYDFDLFRYDRDPKNKKPIGEIDIDEVHAVLLG